ncbi:MAG: DUF1289 domain-containing protein [Cognatishimia sp.]|uniref:DUF1289 domain-containing protein n=1 Tax=Cognatishimia sp. TaxID=2211648 RepID=UPI003B8D4DAA
MPKDQNSQDQKNAVWARNEIASPCIQICVMHRTEKICTGCFRTIEEITEWSQLSPDTRAALIEELPARQALLKKRRGGRKRRQPTDE